MVEHTNRHGILCILPWLGGNLAETQEHMVHAHGR